MLRVVNFAGSNNQGNAMWECICDCGNTTVVRGTDLKSGNTMSCGCYKTNFHKNRLTKHGMAGTKTHDLWCNIKQRCNCVTDHHYKSYGGRGIKVCPEWEDDFQVFYDYVSQLPHFGEKGYSLDRINNDGNYEPGNVRWATNKQQANNRRSSKNGSK